MYMHTLGLLTRHPASVGYSSCNYYTEDLPETDGAASHFAPCLTEQTSPAILQIVNTTGHVVWI